MPLSLQASVSFGLLAALVTSLGLAAVAFRSEWSARQSGLFALSAAGMLITISLLHIVPEAMAALPRAGQFVLGGFFGGLLLSFAMRTFFPEHAGHSPALAFTPLLAVAIHSFFDGVIYSVSFAASFQSGVYAALGLILHEFAEGIIAFAILSRHGFKVREALLWAFLAAGATTPLGALVSGLFVTGLGADTIAALYAVSAGLLLYVATGPMLQPSPQQTGDEAMQLSRQTRQVIGAAIGAAIAAALSTGLGLTSVERHKEQFRSPEPAAQVQPPL